MISLCAVVFLPLYTIFFLYPSFDRILTEKTEEEAARSARLLSARLMPVKQVLNRNIITPQFREEIEKITKEMQFVKVKVFSSSGEIIYSTEAKDIGEINRKDYFHGIVARGKGYTQVVKKSAMSLEGQVMSRDVVETYVPIMDNNAFLGAFELYYDITRSKGKLERLISESSIIVFTMALCLLIGVAVSAMKANRSIRACYIAEEELRKHQEQLEQTIEERTRQIEKQMLEKKQVENSLHDTEAKYRSLIESTEDSIYLVDREYKYLFINKKHLQRMGLFSTQFLGHFYSEFHTPEETAKFAENVKRVFDTGESFQNEHQSSRDNRYFLQTLSPVKDHDGHIIAVTVVSKDITDRRRMEEELRALSLTDELTGLYNRRGFMTVADQYFKLANRMKSSISILYADLDDLKGVNDKYGHKEGDRALLEASGILRETFRESDVVARIGGDEFVVMPAALNSSMLDVVIERLNSNIAAANENTDRKYRLSISFGVAFYDPENPCSIDELLNRGDRMMYEHKKGKNHRT